MGSFVSKQPVRVTVEERPDEWIDLKPSLSLGDWAKFQDAVLKAEFQRGDDEAKISMAAGQLTFRMLELSVVDWRLLDEAGALVPFKRDKIADLDQDDPLVDAAIAKVVERNPTLSGKDATTGSSPSEPTTSESTKPGKAK